MRKQSIPKKYLKDLVQVICSILDVHSIYFIGAQHENTFSSYIFDKQKKSSKRHNYGITIIIISKEYVAEPKHFINKVFTKLGQKIKIYPILYTTNEVNYS
ncbi:hypothetical protein LZ575_05625 [Antarcticibacterium sp. 1MA-6-2]|uniref:hypothetical protein n=1 Tax=Antarcticibacterium sp. 1MA-6-2 TaxID=2908210 RepID=UPI001F22E2A5|nr:hypothetical protein [Antarcticibacterium sp. 1MA-6-2]UJH92081.1 hypothetical protein LZ575_05625 [Antarcticibacterium sp. 1MA-6-2]